jgi:hypothetical protein
MTVAVAIGVAVTVGYEATPVTQKTKKATITRTGQRHWSGGAIIALTLLAAIVVGYIVLTVRWEDFTAYDNSELTYLALTGHDISPQILPGNGRFFPLNQQEFNLIHHFTRSVVGFHALSVVQLLILSCVLLILDDELSTAARAALLAVVLIAPSIVTSFTGLIYPERHVVFWLACLVLFVKQFEKTQSTSCAVAVAVCAQIMIYYKETAFLIVVGFALGRLLLRCRSGGQAGWDCIRLRDKESRLDICLASLGLLFLLYYSAVMFPRPNSNLSYAGTHRLPLPEVVLTYLKLDLLAWLFLIVVLGRTYLILRRRVTPSLLWDGLALGGAAYFTGYLCLGISSAYYLAPVDMIAVLYVGRFAMLSFLNSAAFVGKLAALVLLVAILAQNVSISAFYLFERENIIQAKAEMTRVIKARYQSGVGRTQRLFFPFASLYVIFEFAGYLNYRGIPVEGGTADTRGLEGIMLVSSAATEDGPCLALSYSATCHSGSVPRPGDLVLLMPDDEVSSTEVTAYQGHGEVLFSYEPRPRIPQWLSWYVSRLAVLSPFLRPGPKRFLTVAQSKLRDDRLHASVIAWQ